MPSKIEWCQKTWDYPKIIIDRFWSYVSNTNSGCWRWCGGTFGNGYGQFRWGHRKVKAHRVSYSLFYGPIPDGKIICHHCDNKLCVNPNHLFLGTHKDNTEDREMKGRHPHIQTADLSGTKNPAAKINPLIVRTIRRYRYKGHTYQDLIDGVKFAFNITISKSQIANIIHKRSWPHVK